MKKLLLSFLFLLFLSKIEAQITFCPPGAKWNYEFDNGYFSGSSHNASITYLKDSLVDNEMVKILWSNWFFTRYNPIGGTGRTFIKQYGDTVFMRNQWTNHQWQILYNFAAQQGDNWINVFSSGTTTIAHYTTTVNSIGTVTIGGVTLKELQVSYTNYLDIPYNTSTSLPHQGRIAERIGSNVFLFNYVSGVEKYNSNWKEFLCYTDNDIGVQQFGAKPCNYSNSVGLNDVLENLNLRSYPNPVNDFLSIEGIKGAALILSDVNGRIVKEARLSGDKINVSDLNSGIYFLQIRKGGELVYRNKVVKE